MNGQRNVSRQEKFAGYFEQRSDYLFFIGVPCDNPISWKPVTQLEGNFLCAADLEYFPVEEVKSWIVAYPTTGEIVDYESLFDPLPPGIKSLIADSSVSALTFSVDDLNDGLRMVQIQFGLSPTHPQQKRYYSTMLTNISGQRIRCLGFGAYVRQGKAFELATVSGTLYSDIQFEEWYGVRRGGWIEPRESVCDPSNYGTNCYWIYHFETNTGRRFHAGKQA